MDIIFNKMAVEVWSVVDLVWIIKAYHSNERVSTESGVFCGHLIALNCGYCVCCLLFAVLT